jgi:hypothetical protein
MLVCRGSDGEKACIKQKSCVLKFNYDLYHDTLAGANMKLRYIMVKDCIREDHEMYGVVCEKINKEV